MLKFFFNLKIKNNEEFPGGPVVRTQRFHCPGWGSIPDQGIKILKATWCSQKKERKKEKEKRTNKKRKKIVLKKKRIPTLILSGAGGNVPSTQIP